MSFMSRWLRSVKCSPGRVKPDHEKHGQLVAHVRPCKGVYIAIHTVIDGVYPKRNILSGSVFGLGMKHIARTQLVMKKSAVHIARGLDNK